MNRILIWIPTSKIVIFRQKLYLIQPTKYQNPYTHSYGSQTAIGKKERKFLPIGLEKFIEIIYKNPDLIHRQRYLLYMYVDGCT